MLKIARGFALTLDFATKTAAILAQRRKGKTYTASVLAEEMVAAKQPFVVLDPTGAWWGLRAGTKGHAGLPVLVLGGQHGDVALERTAGRVVADLVVDHPGYYVIDFSLFESGEAERQFAVDFAERLYRAKGQPGKDFPLHLFVDEADRFIPQQIRKGSGETSPRLLGAFEAIVRRGGLRGLGTTLISQRAAVVNKNVLEMLDILIVLRTVGPNDRDAIDSYVKAHGTKEERDALMTSLASLEIGEAWVWEPGAEPPTFERIRIRARHTFNSSATPQPGAARAVPTTLAAVDLAVIQQRMATTIEKARADDPRELRKQIAGLEGEVRDLRKMPPAAASEAVSARAGKIAELKRQLAQHRRALEDAMKILVKVQAVDFLVDTEEQRTALEQAIAAAVRQVTVPIEKRVTALTDKVAGIRQQAGAAEEAVRALLEEEIDLTVNVQKREPFTVTAAPKRLVRPSPAVKASNNGAGAHLPPGEKATLIAAAQYQDGITREQASILTGYKRSSRDAYIQRLIGKGYVAIVGSAVMATDAGVSALGSDYEPLPTGEALQSYWLTRLPPGEAAVLRHLLPHYPHALTRDAIDEATGYKRSSRDAYIQRLKARQLVAVNSMGVRASEVLFD